MEVQMNQSPRGDFPRREKILLLLLLGLLPFLVFFKEIDNDLWFLLNHGKYVLEQGFPLIEPFTIHQGLNFVMQQWLSGVLFFGVWSLLGSLGVRLLVALCLGLSLWVFYRLVMRTSKGHFFPSFLLTLSFGLLISNFMLTRPYIFSIPIFLLELLVLETYKDHGKKRLLWWLPIFSLLLINLQGAMWLMLFVLITPYLIDAFSFRLGRFTGKHEKKWPILLSVLVMAIVGFINPYGWQGMTYLFRSFGVSEINSLVTEMYPATLQGTLGPLIFITILGATLAYALYPQKDIPLRYLLLFLGTAYLSLSAQRGLMFLAICALFPLGFLGRELILRRIEASTNKKLQFFRGGLLVLILLVVFLYGARKPLFMKNYVSDYTMLRETVQQVQKDQEVGEVILYTGYNDGNLAEYYGIPAYLDTRAEVFLKSNNGQKDILKEYYHLQRGWLSPGTFLETYGFTHLILREKDSLRVYLANDPDYVLRYSNPRFELWELKNE